MRALGSNYPPRAQCSHAAPTYCNAPRRYRDQTLHLLADPQTFRDMSAPVARAIAPGEPAGKTPNDRSATEDSVNFGAERITPRLATFFTTGDQHAVEPPVEFARSCVDVAASESLCGREWVVGVVDPVRYACYYCQHTCGVHADHKVIECPCKDVELFPALFLLFLNRIRAGLGTRSCGLTGIGI